MSKKIQKIKIILKSIKKVIKPSKLIFIIILLAGNTFAWFIYSNEVSNSVDVQVRAWKILFEAGDSHITDYYDVVIDEMYPGMEDFSSSIVAHNRSDVAAYISYQIMYARVFDTEYTTVEGRQDAKEDPVVGDLTSAELETLLNNSYPFTIAFNIDTISLDSEYGEATYSVNVVWPYESGDDELDTYWGTTAYDFAQSNPGESCIELRIKLSIVQVDE